MHKFAKLIPPYKSRMNSVPSKRARRRSGQRMILSMIKAWNNQLQYISSIGIHCIHLQLFTKYSVRANRTEAINHLFIRPCERFINFLSSEYSIPCVAGDFL